MQVIASPDFMIRVMGRNEYCIYSLLWIAEQQGQAPVTRAWLVDRMPERTSPGTVSEVLKKLTSSDWQLAVRELKGWRLSKQELERPLCYRHVRRDEPTILEGKALACPPGDAGEDGGPVDLEELKVRLAVLQEFEVGQPKARELAVLKWATPEYIRAQMERAQREHASDGTVRQPVAMAIWRIQQHFAMPKKGGGAQGKRRARKHVDEDEEDRGRYTRGKYAEFVNH